MEEKTPEEKRKTIEDIIEDCEKMAQMAYDLEDCGDCKTCDSLNNCFMGMRNSIGDIAKTLKFVFINIKELDDIIIDIADTLREHDIEITRKKKKPSEDLNIYM